MSLLGTVLGVAVVVLLYVFVSRLDRNHYKRKQEVIEQRQARLDERSQAPQNNDNDNK